MKKRTILFLLMIFITGCGPTLQEIREFPLSIAMELPKESHCVYSKLQRAAIDYQALQPLNCYGMFQATWDPVQRSGEIFAGGDPSNVIMLFQIHESKGIKETLIKVRTKMKGAIGVRYCTARYNQDAEHIINSANLLSCPDL